MKIELKEITVRELTNGYSDNAENGVIGYNGLLDIRPPYQREFIYKDKQRDAVITTITKDYPLNVMYWAVNENDNYEVIDGQQRTISISQYVNGDYSHNGLYFHNLTSDKKEQILNYKVMIYLCSGTDSEKLEWFRTINISGEKLTEQELRNAVYVGPWISDAKRYFSKTNCVAHSIGSDYLNGYVNRQDYFETVIDWISENKIENYMATHQHDLNATALWLYFQSVITWVNATFTTQRKNLMKGINWGSLYNQYKDVIYDSKAIEAETLQLIMDDEVDSKKGIYNYILTRDEKYLSIRTFSEPIKQKIYEQQKGICPTCGMYFEFSKMEADHIIPWSKGGKTTEQNCQMLCKMDNRKKSSK